MNQDDSKVKIELENSDEQLTELLEKFEKNIVGSITKGIEIADNFYGESTSKSDQREGVQADIVPNLFSTIFEKHGWEFLNPIILYKSDWMGAKTEGIYLEKGTYEIKYRVTTTASKGSGLALFNKETKKVEKLLSWQIGVERSETSINVGGKIYLAIHSSGIINITDIQGNFNPKEGESIYIVTVLRQKVLPD